MIKQNKVKPTTLLKVTLLHGCCSRFLNCTNVTKSRKNVSYIWFVKSYSCPEFGKNRVKWTLR